ncbi:CCA tRNA nucleotidyltransferase, mitochondrial [Conoideocrella luteorostrata]|uniref:CCA tRNA nucleotidyltransferase, mitochondrial n=1 Tax=Conoideocrella luteorostrata TaxID=1105319 RepID=A0AAJ0CY21_9HYPO|nr:CCA tRNA nucleotidyltransferase, mitochondrial [Conoideocrella luteorostrata]
MEPSTKRIKVVPERTIELLPAEQLLRELILECARHFPGLEVWIAGGWVRDRLLGITSSDLDLALSKVTGREFGKFLEGFSSKPEIEAKYLQKAADLGIPDARFTRFHIMERNVNKAKKLETAGGKLFGLDIDLVNLRKEVYDGQSRTPEMEFGTPEEDDFRRDATVNSLLFHLKKHEIVDLTGNGLKDLDARIMRTPLDPRQTFMDDPLRVLRLIRIGSKLGFNIDPKAMRCMKDKDIRQALDTMITRDRIGIELFKMMRDSSPVVAFQHLYETNLCTPIFIRLNSPILEKLQAGCSMQGLSMSQHWPTTWPRAYRLLDYLLKDGSNLGKMVRSEANADYLWTMVAYAPFAVLRKTMLRQAVEEATIAIRAPVKISKLLKDALTNFDYIRTIVDSLADQPKKSPQRSIIGMAIRSWGTTWTTQVMYVMLALCIVAPQTPASLGLAIRDSSIDDLLDKSLLVRYSAFADFVWDNNLRNAHVQRPLLDGNEIQSLFGLQNGGRFLRSALDGLMAWQFDHGESGVEEAKVWLLGQREVFGIPQTCRS